MSDTRHCMQCGELITRPNLNREVRMYCTAHEQRIELEMTNKTEESREGIYAVQDGRLRTMRHELNQLLGLLPLTPWKDALSEFEAAAGVLGHYLKALRESSEQTP